MKKKKSDPKAKERTFGWKYGSTIITSDDKQKLRHFGSYVYLHCGGDIPPNEPFIERVDREIADILEKDGYRYVDIDKAYRPISPDELGT